MVQERSPGKRDVSYDLGPGPISGVGETWPVPWLLKLGAERGQSASSGQGQMGQHLGRRFSQFIFSLPLKYN